MKRGIIASILGTAAVAGFGLAAHAEIKENPYQVIIERNPFALRPIPPPAPPPTNDVAPPTPAPEIKLTGITTLLGTPRAMFQVEDKQTKDPTKKYSFPTIAEGDTDGGITVLGVDVDNMRVRIKHGEAETTLDFKNNGVKPGAGGIAGGAAAPVPHPGVNPAVPHNGVVPPPVTGAQALNSAAANNSIAGRSAIVSGGTQQSAAPNGVANLGGLTRPLRTDNGVIMAGGNGQVYNPNPQPTVASQPTMSREEAEARIEAARRMLQERQAAGQAVQHSPNILPPTSLGRTAGGLPTPNGQ